MSLSIELRITVTKNGNSALNKQAIPPTTEKASNVGFRLLCLPSRESVRWRFGLLGTGSFRSLIRSLPRASDRSVQNNHFTANIGEHSRVSRAEVDEVCNPPVKGVGCHLCLAATPPSDRSGKFAKLCQPCQPGVEQRDTLNQSSAAYSPTNPRPPRDRPKSKYRPDC